MERDADAAGPGIAESPSLEEAWGLFAWRAELLVPLPVSLIAEEEQECSWDGFNLSAGGSVAQSPAGHHEGHGEGWDERGCGGIRGQAQGPVAL